MKRLFARILLPLFLLSLLCIPASADTPAFRVTLKPTLESSELLLTVQVDGIPNEEPLAGILFDLTYDPDALRLVNDRTADSAIVCVTKTPGDKWENLTTATHEGKIKVALAVTEDMAQSAKGDGCFVLDFRFRLQENAPAETTVSVPDSSVNAMTTSFKPRAGEGAQAVLRLTDEPPVPDSSDSPSDPMESSDTAASSDPAGSSNSAGSSDPAGSSNSAASTDTSEIPAPFASPLPATGDNALLYPAMLFAGSLLGIFMTVRIRKRKIL